jgi:hypothetical protein
LRRARWLRAVSPSAGAIVETTEAGGPRSFDAGEKIKSRKDTSSPYKLGETARRQSMDEKDALFGMFKQCVERGLHHQQQRSTIANIVLVLSGEIVGLVTFDEEICAGIFLLGLGLFGAAWSAKQHERYAYYLRRARGYRDALAAALPLDMSSINKTADEATAKKYRILHRLRLWYFWTFLYVLVVAVGCSSLFTPPRRLATSVTRTWRTEAVSPH